MSDLIAYKSNALVEASYKLTLQEQRFLLLCIGRLKSGSDAESTELQKTMTVTAEEYFDSFPDMGRKNAEFSYRKQLIVCGTGRSSLRTMRSARSSAGSSIGHSTLKVRAKPKSLFQMRSCLI